MWVCTRCADRTAVVCDTCGAALADPKRYADGFGAWCKPCGAVRRIDLSGRIVRPDPATPSDRGATEVTSPSPTPVRAAGPSAVRVEPVTTSAAGYRAVEQAVRIECRPRPGRAPIGRVSLLAAGIVLAGILLLVAVQWLEDLGPVAASVALAVLAATAITGLAILLGLSIQAAKADEASAVPTRIHAGPRELAVERDGEIGWRVEAPRVERVYATRGRACQVRVRLDDGTEQELVAGLSEEEAAAVVDQVERTLPSRPAAASRGILRP